MKLRFWRKDKVIKLLCENCGEKLIPIKIDDSNIEEIWDCISDQKLSRFPLPISMQIQTIKVGYIQFKCKMCGWFKLVRKGEKLDI